ncbi:MAG: Rpn family recombination-promoting nuclease/putative transposase [Bacteroidales bacterium]|nr:Rpn family recombination-promoting nuclease/putative transposase [Bacteroidales bacterium]
MEIRFINPFIDYGFKKLFVTEGNKDILISFLNAVIDDTTDPIVDLTYKNVELIGDFNGARDSYLDAYCETASGRQFIVEMQNSWQPFFKDRTLYYAAKAIANQAVKDDPTKREHSGEKKKWNYRLKEVYVIAIMNFNFPKKEYQPDDYHHRIMLTDLDDNHVFYDKLTLIYLEMRKVGKAKLDMNCSLDRWLRVLYRLWGEEECPPELNEPVFKKLYREAEYARFTPEQQLTYERSWKRELDIYNEIEGGRILGREEGREEGHKEGLLEAARNMKALGLDDETIMKATGVAEVV